MLPQIQKKYTFSRSHSLPDNHNYVDEGCDISSSCLNCKFLLCKYDDKKYSKKYKIFHRNREINLKIKQGVSIKEIAKFFNLSTRTVRRVIKNDKNDIIKKNTNYKFFNTDNIAKMIIKPRKPLPRIMY